MPPSVKGVTPVQIISAPIRVRVKTIYNDYLDCHMMTWDAVTQTHREGADILYRVAKPYTLQHVAAHYDGLTTLTTVDTQTVDASDGATTETWVVTPKYIIDGEIMIERVQDTDVTLTLAAGTPDEQVIRLTFIEVEPSRLWAVDCL